MGNLTTFTVHVDGIRLIKDHAQDFADKLYEKAIDGRGGEIQVGNFCNLVTVQKTIHADIPTVYVSMGNCLTEVNVYSDDCLELLKMNPNFFDKLVRELSNQVKELKKMKKEYLFAKKNS